MKIKTIFGMGLTCLILLSSNVYATERISEKEKGRVSPMKGKHWTIEQRANVGTAILCVETGEHFYSIRDAERKTGLQRTGIMGVLKGKYKQTGGMTFEYTKK